MRPSKAPVAKFSGKTSAASVFKTIMLACLAHLCRNRDGTAAGKDPEFLHQMRVALRRMRTAMGIFGTSDERFKEPKLYAEIQWLANELGETREWDVFISDTLAPMLGENPNDGVLKKLLALAEAVRAEKQAGAVEAVTSRRYEKFTRRMDAWLGIGEWKNGADAPIRKLAAGMLDKRRAKLMKLGGRLAKLSVAERHAMRIAVKKMRYSVEFMGRFYPKKKTAPFLKRLSKLQGMMGELNDNAVAKKLLADLKARVGAGTTLAKRLEGMGATNSRKTSGLQEQFAGRWESFANRKKFW